MKFIASLAGLNGIDGQIAKEDFRGRAVQSIESGHEFQQVRAAQFQDVFVRLILRTRRVIDIGCRRLLNVVSEDVPDGMRFGEFDEATGAGDIRGEIRDVEAAGIEMIAGQQDAGLRVAPDVRDAFAPGS